jgi:ArsR family transcriptional regulator
MITQQKNKYRNLADYIKAFAHPTRLMIVTKLLNSDECVSNIEKMLEIKQANVSQHLNILRSCRVVDFRIKGKNRCYYLTDPEKTAKLFKCINERSIT